MFSHYMTTLKYSFLVTLVGCCFFMPAIIIVNLQAQPLRWQMNSGGGISWEVNRQNEQFAHTDHLEMSGKQISAIITYGVDSTGRVALERKLIFPMLRTIPNDTRGSLTKIFKRDTSAIGLENGQPIVMKARKFSIHGALMIQSQTKAGLMVTLTGFPSTSKAAYFESYQISNPTNKAIDLQIPAMQVDQLTDAAKGVYGAYQVQKKVYQSDSVLLQPGAVYHFSIVYSARRADLPEYYYATDFEWAKRQELVSNLEEKLILHTPNDTINRMFSFAKLRVSESIFDTKQGLMHGPGGGDYYAAIWANDEAEYASPFFPYLGYAEGVQSAINCYRLFARYMNKAYNPIPSSIIAEGDDVWNGAGDRGDQAMIAYGAAQFALAEGDRAVAERIWPLIKWCLTYLNKLKNSDGVIPSNSDELEGRFPSGKVNLATNSLAYGGFKMAARLARSLGHLELAKKYQQDADKLGIAIDKYFSANVQGYDTYRYFKENKILRSWICLPLVVGLNQRKEGTLKALLSPYLWSKNGILTAAGTKTYWDRATLYAFRGLFYAGETDTAYQYFRYYSAMRLLGEHVPYAVEAWPEGDQRHLSAESGLYCRVVTEGLFGMEPVSFNAFYLQPRLPKDWPEMSLNHIHGFGRDFSIKVTRDGAGEKVTISQEGGEPQSFHWDQKSPLLVQLK